MTMYPIAALKRARGWVFVARCMLGVALCALLAGCPGKADPASTGSSTAATPPSLSLQPASGSSTGDLQPATAIDPTTAGPKIPITAVNLSRHSLQQVPMTFGQPFRSGDIPAGETVAAYLDGKALPTQVDPKATNPDGSLRHAVLTVQVPSLPAGAAEKLSLRAVQAPTALGSPISLADVLNGHFDASITLQVGGTSWHLDARTLLGDAVMTQSCSAYGHACKNWLSGPLVSAWVVGGPVLDAAGIPNPHLAAYFAVRAYGPAPVKRVRVDVIVENDWAYAPNPQNITYDAAIQVGGKTVYSIKHLTHYRQTRWHKTFWWGESDPVYAQQDPAYLQATKAVPRYQDAPAPDAWLAKRIQECAPMKHCDQTQNMANAGAHAGIGPLPQWTAAYVIHPVYSAFRWMLANSDALGSYPVHYRDRGTGRWVSMQDYPCMTLQRAAEMSKCPVAPYAPDHLPTCPKTADCKADPWQANISHDPTPAYVAYMVTGDWYYLGELTDWADWELFEQNEKYRGYTKGYLQHISLRGQAWALRTLGDAAYILPDKDPFKGYFKQVVANNIASYNQQYTDNPNANKLHIVVNGSAVDYPNGGNIWTGTSTWQESYFTWSIGNLKDLGFAGASKLLDWVGQFQVDLMTSPHYCWTLASAYELRVRDTRQSPFYTSIAEMYAKSFPKLQGVKCNSPAMWTYLTNHRPGHQFKKNEMSGYPSSPTGYPAFFQIGLAAAAGADIPCAAKAWHTFATRADQPDYSKDPKQAVIPRQLHEGSCSRDSGASL